MKSAGLLAVALLTIHASAAAIASEGPIVDLGYTLHKAKVNVRHESLKTFLTPCLDRVKSQMTELTLFSRKPASTTPSTTSATPNLLVPKTVSDPPLNRRV